ncbi:MAG TPA: glycosyltransferase family 87 protein [Alphaproteobacteria bacterium]|nr:glycosyltransferase family 87 protein [Alphaproteobacteria bacterium]
MDYTSFDSTSLAKTVRAHKTALANGKLNQPATDADDLDATETRIVALSEEALAGLRTATRAEFDRIEREQAGLTVTEADVSLEDLRLQARQDIATLKSDHRANLERLRLEERHKLRELNYFRESNYLRREAEYPASNVLHWALVALMVLVESVGNAYFFAQNNALWLIGGFWQALLISVLNIALSLLAGVFLLRQLNHYSLMRRLSGMFGLALFFAAAGVFNLLTAHYRTVLELNPDTAFQEAVPHFIAQPLGLGSYEAYLLFLLGVVFVSVALFKGYTADDRYPGYGKVDRAYRTALSAYREAEDALQAACKAVQDKALRTIQQRIDKVQTTVSAYAASIESAQRAAQRFDERAKVINAACQTVLKQYREDNRKVRTIPEPGYFATFPDLDQSIDTPDIAALADRRDALSERLAGLQHEAKAVQGEVQALVLKELERIGDFIEKIEITAAQKMKADTDFLSSPA